MTGFPITINGNTYTAAMFTPFGYVANFPNLMSDFATVVAQVLAAASGAYPEATVASAATTNIGAASSLVVKVAGSVTITSLGGTVSTIRFVRFTGAPLLTNGASLVLPGGQDIPAAAGDWAIFVSDAAAVWRCIHYQRVDSIIGALLVAASAKAARDAIGAAPFEVMAASNILVNSGMEVSQRYGTTSTALTVSNVAYSFNKTIDNWTVETRGTFAGNFQQVSDAPVGHANSLKITIGTAQASLGTNDSCAVYQRIEPARISHLAFGNAAALPVVLAFWIKAHRTGQYGGTVKQVGTGGQRTYGFAYTVNVADTWEYKTVSVAGDTTGTWDSMFVMFGVATGATLQVALGWSTTNGSNVAGSVNGVGATTDVFQITGVVLLPGTSVPTAAQSSLLLRPLGEETNLCYRYFRRFAAGQPLLRGFMFNATLAAHLSMPISPPMLSAPTVTMNGNLPIGDSAGNTTTISSLSSPNHTAASLDMNATTGTLTANTYCFIYNTGSASLDADASLS